MRRLIVAGICVLAGLPAYAEPVLLGDATLKQAVAGKTVHLNTPFGVAIPITYHGNGLMSGKAGVLEYFLGAEADRGRWWVADGKLCQKWFKWLDAQPSCMRLQQDGDKIMWRRYDGLTGTATIASAPPPGAEAAPRGLGGPAPAPQLGRSLVATEPAETARAASTALPVVKIRQAPKAAAPKAVAAVAQTPPRQPQSDTGAKLSSAFHGRLPMATEHLARTKQDDRWCHSILPGATETDTAPDLVLVARLPYVGRAMPSPTNACLTVEPPLQHVAKIGIEGR